MAAKGIITFDLSGRTGYCYGVEKPEKWGWITIPATPDNPGRRWASVRNEMSDLVGDLAQRTNGASDIDFVIEKTFPSHMQTHANTAIQQMGLATIAEIVAYDEGAKLVTVAPSTVRTSVMGRGFGKMTKKEKEGGAIVRWLNQQGYITYDHNTADAILMWLYRRGIKHGG